TLYGPSRLNNVTNIKDKRSFNREVNLGKYEEIQDGKKTIDTVTLRTKSNDSSLLDNIKLQKC
ncbi:17789_t:CDS:1, partial [Cetraspora pellucida]